MAKRLEKAKTDKSAQQAREIAEWGARIAGLLQQPLDPTLRKKIEAQVARVHKSLPKWGEVETRKQIATQIGVAAATLAAGRGTETWWAKWVHEGIGKILADRAAPPSAIEALSLDTVRSAIIACAQGPGAPSKASGRRKFGGAAKAVHSVFTELAIDGNTSTAATAQLLKLKVPLKRMRESTRAHLNK